MILHRLAALLLALCIAACGGAERPIDAAAGTTPSGEENYPLGKEGIDFRPGELLVGRSATSAGPTRGLAQELPLDFEVIERFTIGASPANSGKSRAAGTTQGLQIERIRLPEGTGVAEALDLVHRSGGVLFAEPNYLVRKAVLPNDPHFSLQWGLRNTGQTVTGDSGRDAGVPGADIAAPAGWDLTTDASDVVVAVIDTGLDYRHPDLAANLWRNADELAGNGIDDDGNGFIDDVNGWNFAYDDNAPLDDDIAGHGTHVGGIIGAVGNNGTGVSGVAWGVALMPLKFLDQQGFGDIADLARAIDYARLNGARIINASFTYPQSCIERSPSHAEQAAIEAADRAGILVVAAAGNAGCDNDVTPFYPASHTLPNMLAVAASDQHDGKLPQSNEGPNSVDLAAPGANILSTIPLALGSYDFSSGTSMAAPFVAGGAALLWARHPELSHLEIKERLLQTVDPLSAFSGRTVSGGRLNLHRALADAPNDLAPVPPSGLSAELTEAGEVQLLWQDHATGESGFRIERAAGDAPYTLLTTIAADRVAYMDIPPADGVRYRYRVAAVAGTLASSWAGPTEVIVPLIPPDRLSAAADPAGGVSLAWRDRSGSELGYRIERRGELQAEFSLLAELPADTIRHLDRTAALDIFYHYRVQATGDGIAPSAFSAEASASATASAPTHGGSSSSDSRCFIATAAYGSPMAEEVDTLRRFRDRRLLPTPLGRRVVELYYRLSPPLAEVIAGNESLRGFVRLLLSPFVRLAACLTDPEEE